MKISVLGSGSWGCAISTIIAKEGYNVSLWSFFKEEVDRLSADRENKLLLPGCKFPNFLSLTNDMGESVHGAEIVLVVVPSPVFTSTIKTLQSHIADNQIVLILTKGLDENTLDIFSDVAESLLPNARVAVMSGPSHAEEVAKSLPTTNVVASKDESVSQYVQGILMSDTFRLYTSTDVIGVQIGGALKNVIALCAGVSDGLGFGDNTKAALMTRGLAEISRLGEAMGARRETFLGLSGVGDLIVTCTSMHSRNRRAGILLGQGKQLDDVLKEVGMVVEGVNTVTTACKLAQKYNVEMPICEAAYDVLFNGKSARDAVTMLMRREKRSEL